MLKNAVPIKEYVLMTTPVHAEQNEALKRRSMELEHDFEGIGKTATHWVELAALDAPALPAPSGWTAFIDRMKLTARATPYYFKLSKPLAGTRLMAEKE
jgi:hypothetical protein